MRPAQIFIAQTVFNELLRREFISRYGKSCSLPGFVKRHFLPWDFLVVANELIRSKVIDRKTTVGMKFFYSIEDMLVSTNGRLLESESNIKYTLADEFLPSNILRVHRTELEIKL